VLSSLIIYHVVVLGRVVGMEDNREEERREGEEGPPGEKRSYGPIVQSAGQMGRPGINLEGRLCK